MSDGRTEIEIRVSGLSEVTLHNSTWSDGERDGYICWNQRDGRTEIEIRVSGL